MDDYQPIPCFKAYDVRGQVPQELNVDLAYRIGRAFVKFLDAKTVVVGRDIRATGSELSLALAKGLTDGGANVFDIGLCGTEMVYFATSHLQAGGGIMITASHNPPEYNGMKFVREESRPISSESGMKEIERMASLNRFDPIGEKGVMQFVDIDEAFVRHILSVVDVSALSSYKVVVNGGNGCAGPILDRLEPYLPFELIKIHHEPDSTFPHGVPNPFLIENRAPTITAVQQNHADIGVAWDGDFDRCFIFDEKGNFIEGYYIVGFLAEAQLDIHPGATIIHDPRLIWNTIELVEERGGKPKMCKVGHSFIKEMMRNEKAVYGGEMSAHHYFKDFFYSDSGMIPWLLILEIMSQEKKPLSQLVEERIRKFPVSGEINKCVKNPDEVLARIQRYYENEHPKVDRVDGLSLEFPEWRVNIRTSNTEPILRMNIETRGNQELVQAKVEEVVGIIENS
ncbi:MAG: phosphomannomutase [Candidatus Omnitrophota bacterium]|jgi:phosphomannomutase/phosphomannomutase/phosphoglucomutase|nr:MAG: phosphomannomutase [Candidatus Omnitrophota bacterium]